MRVEQIKVDGRVIVPNCYVARTFLSRLFGLIGRSHLKDGDAMLFPRCSSIHTFFMRFEIDVVAVSSVGEVLAVKHAMKPWRLMLPVPKASHIIELGAHATKRYAITPGTRLECAGVWE